MAKHTKTVDPAWYRTPHWARLKKVARERCGGRCERCSRELADAGHLHHLTYERAGAELETDVQMICYVCHDKEHPGKYTWISPSLAARYREEAAMERPERPSRPKRERQRFTPEQRRDFKRKKRVARAARKAARKGLKAPRKPAMSRGGVWAWNADRTLYIRQDVPRS